MMMVVVVVSDDNGRLKGSGLSGALKVSVHRSAMKTIQLHLGAKGSQDDESQLPPAHILQKEQRCKKWLAWLPR